MLPLGADADLDGGPVGSAVRVPDRSAVRTTAPGDSALLTSLIYGWVWLRFRPTQFIMHPERIEIVWPLKRREFLRSDIVSIEWLTRHELKQNVGWGMRVGAGGLWGGFGWL
jgi:hypothetical protein